MPACQVGNPGSIPGTRTKTTYTVLPPGFEPGIAVPKTAVISVSPRERSAIIQRRSADTMIESLHGLNNASGSARSPGTARAAEKGRL